MVWIFYDYMESLRFQIEMVSCTLEFSFEEIKHIMASSHKVECCHFSSDGKLLVTGGHDNKVSARLIQL